MRKNMLFLLALALSFPIPAMTQHKVNLVDLVNETQRQSVNPHALSMVWWVPVEFWQASFAAESSISAQESEKLISVLRPYLLVAIVDGKIGPLGGVTYESEQTVRAKIKLVDSRGRSYLPFAEERISADVKNLTQMMRPVLANIMGPLGENFRFFVFPARDDAGTEIANPTADNDFEIRLGEERFHWQLPLGSLLAPKVCPEDGEVLNGAWSYCPWHGTKLKRQEPPAADAKKSQGSAGR